MASSPSTQSGREPRGGWPTNKLVAEWDEDGNLTVDFVPIVPVMVPLPNPTCDRCQPYPGDPCICHGYGC